MAAGLPTVLSLPAVAAVVLEAGQVSEVGNVKRDHNPAITEYEPAEVRTLLQQAAGAESIFQVGINLDSLVELRTFDLHKGSRHRLHVGPGAAEGDPTTSNGIFVFVSVDTCQARYD